MRSKRAIEETIRMRMNLTLDPPLRNQLLARALHEQKESQEMESAPRGPVIRRMIMRSPMAKLSVAAAIVIAASVILSQWGSPLESVAWADVAERFASVPFFHLTMYIGQDAPAETKKIEIWKSEEGRFRAHEGDKVFFGNLTKKESQIVAFDGVTKKPLNVGGHSPGFLTMLCKEGQFSLNTLTASFPPGVKGITPLPAADTAASRETVLFEAKHDTTPERLTIWALRDSRLPIRMRFEDPRQKEFGDFFFDYSEKKDSTFFDPEAFAHQ